ncbi:GumC family protein [Rhizobium sp. ARZ01]|nr:GumC family protein [Rhizobium sp. ARZ01]
MYEGKPEHPTPVASTTGLKGTVLSSRSAPQKASSRGTSARRSRSPVINTRTWLQTGGNPSDESSVSLLDGGGGSVELPNLADDARLNNRLAILQELLRLDPLRIFSWMQAGWLWIVLFTVFGAVAGYGVVLVVKPRYTASIDLLVDPANLKVVANDVFSESMQRDRQLLDVDSKLRIITSGNVLNRVVADLKLQDDPEFVSASSRSPAADALVALEKRISARRDERSFIVNIAAWTQDRQKSVDIVNAVAKSFQEELVGAESEGAGRAASALVARLDDLKVEVTKAESDVEQFKREHGLQSISGELASTLMSQQMNTKLVEAKERLIQARMRVNNLTSASPESRLSADSLQSETMTLLRTQYATLKQRVTAEAAVLGPRHPSILTLNPQLDALERQIRAETDRIVQAARIELEQAQTALDALTSQADHMRASVFQDTTAQIQLRELEREARAKAAVYEAFMARAGEAAERQQIDTTNIRIVSPAVIPANRSFPPRGYMLAAIGAMMGFCLGLLFAASLGLWRDFRHLAVGRSEANV